MSNEEELVKLLGELKEMQKKMEWLDEGAKELKRGGGVDFSGREWKLFCLCERSCFRSERIPDMFVSKKKSKIEGVGEGGEEN